MNDTLQQMVGYSLMGLGAFFYFLAGLGLLRMPDIYTKLQASTKATTLGTFSLVLGVGLTNFMFLGKALLVVIFVALTNPVASSLVLRAAYRCRERVCDQTVVDETASTLPPSGPEGSGGGEVR